MKINATVLALAALASLPISAQSQLLVPPAQQPALVRGEAGWARVHVVYDVSAQRIRSVTPVPAGSLGVSGVCFDNSEPTQGPDLPWLYVVSNAGEELVAWGVKNCGESGLLRSVTIQYGSSALPQSRGGPGGAMSVALFQGTRGFGQLGTEVFRATVAGLPSQTYGDLTLDFGADPLPLRDGNIGWSILQIDSHTGPLLVKAPKAVLGTADALDLYVPGPATPPAYVGTFNYGGCQSYPFVCANLFIQLNEIDTSELASSGVLNGNGVNPVLLSEILPARIGHVWAGRIDITGQPLGTSTLLFASTAPLAPVPSPLGEVLISPAGRLSAPIASYGGYAFAVPFDTALVGLRVYLQGLVDPWDYPVLLPSFLTNALRVRFGY